MPAATLEHVIILALRRNSFCQLLANDIDNALRTVDWILPPQDLNTLRNDLPALLSDFQNNPRLMDLIQYLSYLCSDERAGIQVASDHYPIPHFNQIPERPGEPSPAWIK